MEFIVKKGDKIVITEVHESSVEESWKEYFELNAHVRHLMFKDFQKRMIDTVKEKLLKPKPYQETLI